MRGKIGRWQGIYNYIYTGNEVVFSCIFIKITGITASKEAMLGPEELKITRAKS